MAFADGQQVNVTVQDTDPSINYLPARFWVPEHCISCFGTAHTDAGLLTYHNATTLTGRTGSRDEKGPDAPTLVWCDSKWKPPNTCSKSSTTYPTADFAFNGSAIHIYSVQAPTACPPKVNVTFVLDGQPQRPFLKDASHAVSALDTDMLVFSRTNLSESTHNLRMIVGPDSTFLLNYLVYTRSERDNASNETMATTMNMSSSPSKHKNVATFAGAIGGVLGVLVILSAGISFSIIRRRRKFNRRDPLPDVPRLPYFGSTNHGQPDDSPPMDGPAPFIPRYFRDTRVPSPSLDTPLPPSILRSDREYATIESPTSRPRLPADPPSYIESILQSDLGSVLAHPPTPELRPYTSRASVASRASSRHDLNGLDYDEVDETSVNVRETQVLRPLPPQPSLLLERPDSMLNVDPPSFEDIVNDPESPTRPPGILMPVSHPAGERIPTSTEPPDTAPSAGEISASLPHRHGSDDNDVR